jgi:iron complex outermembrane receptor protein
LLDLGARYRFALGSVPAVVRVQVQNVTNAHGFEVTPAGGFRYQDTRRALLQIAADF